MKPVLYFVNKLFTLRSTCLPAIGAAAKWLVVTSLLAAVPVRGEIPLGNLSNDTLTIHDAQSLAGKPISSIHFSGKFRTRRFILRREIDSRAGLPLDLELLDRDRKKIFGLGIFSKVQPRIIEHSDSVAIDFRIKEVWTLLPLLSIGRTDGKLDWSVGAVEKDFLGLYMQTAVLYRRYEGKNSGYFSVSVPRAFGRDFNIGLALSDQREIDPLRIAGVTGDYDYEHKSIVGVLGRRLHERIYASVFSGYDRENWTLRSDSKGKPHVAVIDYPRYSFGGGLTLGRVYYDRYFYEGSDLSASGSLINERPDGSFDKWHSGVTGRVYRAFGRFNLASRAFLQLSSADERVQPYYVSGDVNVRGYQDKIRRGDYLFVSNLELRMKAIETGLLYSQAAIFADYGVIWGRFSDFSQRVKDPYWTVGVGLRGAIKSFLGNMGRLDLAINPHTGGMVIYVSTQQFF